MMCLNSQCKTNFMVWKAEIQPHCPFICLCTGNNNGHELRNGSQEHCLLKSTQEVMLNSRALKLPLGAVYFTRVTYYTCCEDGEY